ncbi:MAG: radical SAM protein [Treponema sp.]|nr:radical SAM protein [Treponema sp.]
MMPKNKLSVIWNITDRCPYECSFCCMDAGPATKGGEMSLEQKLRTVKELGRVNCRVDLSGGEVMFNKKDHLPVIELLSHTLGRESVGLSCSGAFINDSTARRLSGLVGDVEITMDAHPNQDYRYRPAAYHLTAAKAGVLFKRWGISVGVQTVVTKEHMCLSLLREIYWWICDNRIDAWSILKFFPSGRGQCYPELELSDPECRKIVAYVHDLDAANHDPHKPKCDIHYLMPGTEKENVCRCVKKSVGILPDGRVTACFWGLGAQGSLKHDKFLLGNITRQSFDEILSGENARFWQEYCGECYLACA